MREHVKRSLIVILLALAGVGVSVMIDVVHTRLVGDHQYASFCNVNASVNCDAVLTSRYAELFGIAVSRWAVLFYGVVIVLAIGVARAQRASLRESFATAVLLLQVWGFLFAAYLAGVAFFVLHTVCLMCSALYVISIALVAAAWWLRASVQVVGRRQRADSKRRDRWVWLGSVAAIGLLAVVAGWEAFGRSGHVRATDPQAIAQLRPEFYQWFFKQPVLQVVTDGSQALGSATAAVTVVEFSDFECGHCFNFHETLENVLRTSGQDVRVVFRHFPLDSGCNPNVASRLHPQACLAATAAECAGEQGKFWPYHNLLFDNQQALGREFLIAYADRLGLDATRFASCLGSSEARARVERDARDAAELGVDSTPTVFINGRRIKGALDADQLGDALILGRVPQ